MASPYQLVEVRELGCSLSLSLTRCVCAMGQVTSSAQADRLQNLILKMKEMVSFISEQRK